MSYTEEERSAMLARLCQDGSLSMRELSRQLGISCTTLIKWAKQAGIELSETAEDKRSDNRRYKLQCLKDTANLTELEIGKYCRSKGILSEDLRKWEEEFVNSPQGWSAAERVCLKHEVAELRKDLARKDRALSEAAALLILSKKAEAIWGGGEEEK